MSVTSAETARPAEAALSRRLIACALALLLVGGVVALLAPTVTIVVAASTSPSRLARNSRIRLSSSARIAFHIRWK